MTPFWTVLIGPGMTCEVLCVCDTPTDMLRVVGTLDAMAPLLRTSVYFRQGVDGGRVLVVEDGIWRVTAPDSFEPAEQLMERPTPRRAEAALEPCELAIGGGR